jgi:DNA excision repair protein ERCC-4
LAKEKKAFENLIRKKEHLVVSLPYHGPCDAIDSIETNAQDSRVKSRNALLSLHPRKVVVDVREFRSSLPSALHSHNFQLIPRTITVGDYVIASEICVERKGISDLFQSFASGRLYNQAESMSKYYKYPCLLIEFSADKSFSLTVGAR